MCWSDHVLGGHSKSVPVFSHHLPLQRRRHGWLCAVDDRHAFQERGPDVYRQNGGHDYQTSAKVQRSLSIQVLILISKCKAKPLKF